MEFYQNNKSCIIENGTIREFFLYTPDLIELNKRSETLESLVISCYKFNEELNLSRFKKLKNISINSLNFNSKIILPDTSDNFINLQIMSDSFNQSLDFLNNRIISLNIKSKIFNQTLLYLPSSCMNTEIYSNYLDTKYIDEIKLNIVKLPKFAFLEIYKNDKNILKIRNF
jgi:hypothetical protein